MSTVLLVEDYASDEMLTLRALRNLGVTVKVDVARDGAEALDYLFCQGAYAERPDEKPKFVMLDLNLPRLGGLEVLSRIRADPRTTLLPVVILSSSDHETDALQGYVNGANSYVCKPVGFGEFEAAVQELALYWLTLNNGPASGDAGQAFALPAGSGLTAAPHDHHAGRSSLASQYDPPAPIAA
jgi:two-component system response regulator